MVAHLVALLAALGLIVTANEATQLVQSSQALDFGTLEEQRIVDLMLDRCRNCTEAGRCEVPSPQQCSGETSEDGGRTSSSSDAPLSTKSPLKVGENFLSPEQLSLTELYFYQTPEFGLNVSRFVNMMTKVKLVGQSTSDYFIHRYESVGDIGRAAGPQVDQELCLSQLRSLVQRAEYNLKDGAESKDLNFVRYMDTFGGLPTGRFIGNWFLTGSYEACRRTRISFAANRHKVGGQSSARYCIGSLRYKDWQAGSQVDEMLAIKTGLCLPASCDSLGYKNKFALIKQLNDYNARPLDHSHQMELAALYCAPDPRSQLGAWWRSKPTLLTMGLTCVWLLVLLAATLVDGRRRRQALANQKQSDSEWDRICGSLSIVNNVKSLLRTERPTRKEDGQQEENQPDENRAESAQRTADITKNQLVNLDVLEGMKVLAAIYVMSGHVILLAGIQFNNGLEVASSGSLAWLATNMIPAFAVNAFFAITGILSSYLIFTRDPSGRLITSPSKWTALILFRYLRIMPMYALVTLFCKHVARYIGDGPLWDYGTSSLAARRVCEQESWAWTLLLGANFKSPMKHCIPSAWYLANDFQFFLATPIFVAALYLRPRLGKGLLQASAAASFLAGIWNIMQSDAHSLRPVAEFMPHAFVIFINHLHDFYTQPQYRIAAYLIGLLMGYWLFEHEQEQRAHLERATGATGSSDRSQPPGGCWPAWMTRYGGLFAIGVVLGTALTPYLAMLGPFRPSVSKILIALHVPTFYCLYSMAVGTFVLLAATGHANRALTRLLSLPFWRPLSRAGLCVMLINIEVIAYLTQTSRTTHYMDNHHLSSLNVMAFIYSYLVAMVVYVLFELPIRAVIDHLLIAKMAPTGRRNSSAKSKPQ